MKETGKGKGGFWGLLIAFAIILIIVVLILAGVFNKKSESTTEDEETETSSSSEGSTSGTDFITPGDTLDTILIPASELARVTSGSPLVIRVGASASDFFISTDIFIPATSSKYSKTGIWGFNFETDVFEPKLGPDKLIVEDFSISKHLTTSISGYDALKYGFVSSETLTTPTWKFIGFTDLSPEVATDERIFQNTDGVPTERFPVASTSLRSKIFHDIVFFWDPLGDDAATYTFAWTAAVEGASGLSDRTYVLPTVIETAPTCADIGIFESSSAIRIYILIGGVDDYVPIEITTPWKDLDGVVAADPDSDFETLLEAAIPSGGGGYAGAKIDLTGHSGTAIRMQVGFGGDIFFVLTSDRDTIWFGKFSEESGGAVALTDFLDEIEEDLNVGEEIISYDISLTDKKIVVLLNTKDIFMYDYSTIV